MHRRHQIAPQIVVISVTKNITHVYMLFSWHLDQEWRLSNKSSYTYFIVTEHYRKYFEENNNSTSGLIETVAQRCSVKEGVLRNFAKFTGKHLCQSLFFYFSGGCFWFNYSVNPFHATVFFLYHLWEPFTFPKLQFTGNYQGRQHF